MIFERIRELSQAEGKRNEKRCREVRSTTLFTTHTPVAAGHDTFSLELVESQLGDFWGTDSRRRDALFGLAMHDNGEGPLFNMTVLAVRGSGAVNAVSQVHRDVTSRMFAPIFSDVAESVQAVTNGVHLPTWIAPAINGLFEQYLGPDWKDHQDDLSLWDRGLPYPGR